MLPAFKAALAKAGVGPLTEEYLSHDDIPQAVGGLPMTPSAAVSASAPASSSAGSEGGGESESAATATQSSLPPSQPLPLPLPRHAPNRLCLLALDAAVFSTDLPRAASGVDQVGHKRPRPSEAGEESPPPPHAGAWLEERCWEALVECGKGVPTAACYDDELSWKTSRVLQRDSTVCVPRVNVEVPHGQVACPSCGTPLSPEVAMTAALVHASKGCDPLPFGSAASATLCAGGTQVWCAGFKADVTRRGMVFADIRIHVRKIASVALVKTYLRLSHLVDRDGWAPCALWRGVIECPDWPAAAVARALAEYRPPTVGGGGGGAADPASPRASRLAALAALCHGLDPM